MTLSIRSNGVKEAYNKGYRIIEGDIMYENRVVKKILEKGKHVPYYFFNIRDSIGRNVSIYIHRLVAYQKYGDEYLYSNLQARHLDGNSLNNLEGNIAIGTQSENEMDKSNETRLRVALNATEKVRKFNHKEVLDYYNKTKSYKETMNYFNITSKGTLNFILKKSFAKSKVVIC